MTVSLQGKTAIVTGSGAGLGAAYATALAAAGAAVVVNDVSADAAEATVSAIRQAGGKAVAVVAPVGTSEVAQQLVDAAVAEFGGLDVVVHAAQVMAYGRIEDVPRDVYEHVVDVAVHGTAVIARVVLPVFRRQGAGHLVVVNSLLGNVATPLMGSYVTAKWGQLGLIRVLQQETRDEPGISVSAVQPGGVDTPIYVQAASWTGSTGRPPPPVYAPQRVARAVLSTIDRPRRVVQSGILNPLVTAGFRLFPGVYDALVGPLLQRLAIADDDVPPTEGNVFESNPEGNATEGRWRSI